MKRTPLRRTWLRRKAKRRAPEAVAEAWAWRNAVLLRPVATLKTQDERDWWEEIGPRQGFASFGRLVVHHVIPRQVCRRFGAPEWDPRNGVPMTKRRHERHHSAHEPLRRHELPATTLADLEAFAAEHGLTAWLDRHLT